MYLKIKACIYYHAVYHLFKYWSMGKLLIIYLFNPNVALKYWQR